MKSPKDTLNIFVGFMTQIMLKSVLLYTLGSFSHQRGESKMSKNCSHGLLYG